MTDIDVPVSEDVALHVGDPVVTPEAEASDPHVMLEEVAGEMGWTPKDKWKGDPDKWRDARAFLKATPAVLKSQREAMERNNRAAAQLIEKNRREAIADAEARIAAAAKSGDEEAAARAAQDLREASRAPDPLVEEFGRKHAWMTTDRKARQVALEAAQEVFENGGSTAEQLAAAEAEVRKRFPEHFGEDAPSERTNGQGRQPPAVQGGQRTASSAPRKRGWSDIPQAARDAATRAFIRKGLLTEQDYAETYWSENA